jgi:DNA repair protein RadC
MDKQFSVGSTDIAFAGIAGPTFAPDGPYDDHFILGLPDAGHTVCGHLAARPARQGFGERSILEQILAAARVSDWNVTADRLLSRYGSLAKVLHAAEQNKIAGRIGSTLHLLVEAHKALLRIQVTARPVLSSSKSVSDYLQATMAHLPYEQVRLLYLNSAHCLISDQIVSTGTIDEAPFYPREIIRHALDAGATGLIVAHNHPSGDARPSAADISNTRALLAACETVQISLHDHIVVGTGRTTSMRASGMLQR